MGMTNGAGIIRGSRIKVRNNFNSKPGAKARRQRRGKRLIAERDAELQALLALNATWRSGLTKH